MPYGIANAHGRPSQGDAFQLLEYALAQGVTTWDTAPVYGDSERTIGRFLKQQGLEQQGLEQQGRRPQMSSKLPSLRNHTQTSTATLQRFVTEQVEKSLERLNVTCLDYYLLHDENDFVRSGQAILAGLESHLESGTIAASGSPPYSPEIAFAALEDERVSCFQLPYNLWDRRFERFILAAEERQKTVFARSIFLQGLLTLPKEAVEKKLPAAAPHSATTQRLADQHNLSSSELAFGFVRHNPAVTSMVVGVETIAQLQANVELLHAAPLEPTQYQSIAKTVGAALQVPDAITNPSRWTSA